jgi:GNAT superfamily N-acetyltransferase
LFSSERLSTDHLLADFDSGQSDLDQWLKVAALDQQNRRYSNTFVWTTGDEVVAYFTLRTHTVDRAEVPKKVGRGGPATIPAILLAKLALAKQLHGRGYGTYLLLDALSRCVGASEAGPGARLVVVDAIDEEAFEFYREHDFQLIAPDSMTLFRSMKDVAKDFEQP